MARRYSWPGRVRGAAGALDLDPGARLQAKLTIGDHLLTGPQATGDDRLAGTTLEIDLHLALLPHLSLPPNFPKVRSEENHTLALFHKHIDCD